MRRFGPLLPVLCATTVAATSLPASPAAAAKKAAVDTLAPEITHTRLQTCPKEGPCVVRATIVDQSGVFDPTLLFRLHGTSAFDRAPMKAVAGEKNVYEGVVPAALVAAGDVDYIIEAFDVEGNGPARVGTEDAPVVLHKPVVEPPPLPPPTTPPPAVVEEEGGDTGLIIGIVAGSVAVVAVAAVGIGVAVYALRPPAPQTVGIVVDGPTPFAAVTP